jgi:hypothetical protein
MGTPRWVRVVTVLSCMPKAIGNLNHQLETLVCLTPEARLDRTSYYQLV